MNEQEAIPNALDHPLWDPAVAAANEIRFMHVARRRAMVAAAAMVVSLAIGGYCAWEYVQITLTPPAIAAVTPSGWVFSGPQRNLRVTDEQLFENWRQIIEAHFARTEKGVLPTLRLYSTEETAASINDILRRSDAEGAFIVSLTIVEHRLKARTDREAELHIRGRLTVVDRHKTASSEAFLAAHFKRGRAEGPNALGWRLAGVSDLKSEKFFSAERERVRSGVFGEGKATPDARR